MQQAACSYRDNEEYKIHEGYNIEICLGEILRENQTTTYAEQELHWQDVFSDQGSRKHCGF